MLPFIKNSSKKNLHKRNSILNVVQHSTPVVCACCRKGNLISPTANVEYTKCFLFAFKIFKEFKEKKNNVELICSLLHPSFSKGG